MGQLRVVAAAALAAVLVLSACAKSGGARGAIPSDALDQAIGAAIGDPTTCVLIVDPTSGRTLYQYGQSFNCTRPLPACDRPGTLTAKTAIALANGGGRGASCPMPDNSGAAVGWAENSIAGASRSLVYSAVMDGQRALPGHEMAARLADVFSKVAL